MIRVCFHGAESTGKSTLAEKLASEWGCPLVGEYGRAHAEAHGAAFTMTDLLAIAREQDRLMRERAAGRPHLLLLDTDPLMTAAWAAMLFGEIPDALLGYEKAELYLLFAPDVPWIEDGTRMFGTAAERGRFAEIAHDLLQRTGVAFETVGGDWAERELQARRSIAAALQVAR